MPRNELSREFNLVAAGCEWPASAARDQRLRDCAASALDWDLVLKLAHRHRVEGLLHRALTEAGVEAPERVRLELARSAAAIGTQSLLQSAESAWLRRLLSERGIEAVFLKGVALAALAYGMLGVKQAWDIDLLVGPEEAALAADVLGQAGYRRSIPGSEVPDELFRHWMTISKESLWIHEKSGMVVELHTALVDNPSLLPGVSARSDLQLVRIGPGVQLPTLRTDELFAYLCVHGATHAWARLKWLADVAALLRKVGPEETERLYRRSIELGAGRSSAQALMLCARLLQLPLPSKLQPELRRDRPTQWLEELAISAMSGRGATELDDTVFGTVVINLSHFLLGRGWRYKYSELARKTRNPEDQLAMPLPPYLHFIYPILAVPRWVWRRYQLSRS
ncbi:MAG: nucleotidyltransferase family protein [Pseudomonadota bacterium]|nr:nucleotidyltransferase family protein [Pseudomonadota bacterium]